MTTQREQQDTHDLDNGWAHDDHNHARKDEEDQWEEHLNQQFRRHLLGPMMVLGAHAIGMHTQGLANTGAEASV